MIDKVKTLAALLVVIGSVALYYQLADLLQLARVGIVVAGTLLAGGLMLTTESGQSAWAFVKGANIERQKVVWPTRPEAMQVTLFVIILVILIGLMMWAFDSLSFYAIYDVILRVRGA